MLVKKYCILEVYGDHEHKFLLCYFPTSLQHGLGPFGVSLVRALSVSHEGPALLKRRGSPVNRAYMFQGYCNDF
jgi:hypothetical protein